MALDQSVLSELADALKSSDGIDLVREAVRLVLQELIESELSSAIGAGLYERTEARTNERNGHRPRVVSTKAGDISLGIPKLRKGSFFPSILEPRRRIDQALYAVVMEAYVHGVSTRAVDELVQALGIDSGISKSEVSRICAGLDTHVSAFKERRLDHTSFPYIWLDATYLHVRDDHHVVSKAVVIATGVSAQGHREVLGFGVGDSEDEVFWRSFLSSLRRRGLCGVRLVISDQHAGLVAALRRCLQGAAHQRCRVHFARNLLARVPKGQQEMVAAAFRTVFAYVTPEEISSQYDHVVETLAERFEKAAGLHRLGQGGGPRLLLLPASALAPDLEHEPARAPQPRVEEAMPSRRVSSRMRTPSRALPDACFLTSTTSGRQPTAATSRKARWQTSWASATMSSRKSPSSSRRTDRRRGS